MRTFSENPRVFISYARSDGETAAHQLRQRLELEHPEITLWQDRVRMQGGVGWWKQIAEALESVEYLVLVMTPSAFSSETCQREWRYAKQHGVCVYPVIGSSAQDLNYDTIPRWMRNVHIYDLAHEWDIFINGLKSPCQASRVPFMAPDLPANFVERPEIDDQIVQYLIGDDQKQDNAANVALRGAGGLGKTTLAVAVCHNEEVIATYDGGILWVTLGETPQIQQAITKLYAALSGERPAFVDEEDASYHFAERLEGLRCLIVIDDVWNPAHLRPFLRGGKTSSRLITTRLFEVASEADFVDVEEMTTAQSIRLLARRAGIDTDNTVPVAHLAERLDHWPLLLELGGSALANRIKRGDSVPSAIEYIDRKLDKHGVTAFDHRNPTARNQAVETTIDASLDLIGDADGQRLYQLAVFPDDVDIPLNVVATLWKLDQWEAEEIIEQLENLALLKFHPQTALLKLHDLIRQYLMARVDDLLVLHSELADRLSSAAEPLTDYRVRWLPYHLAHANRFGELRRLLTSIEWLRTKIRLAGPALAVDDFGLIPHEADLQLLGEAIRLSAYVVTGDTAQLPSQLLARLPVEAPGMSLIREECLGWSRAPWMAPLKPLLTAPGSPLVATLSGHQGRVRSVCFSPNGKFVVSGSDDGSVRVWDVHRAIQLREMKGHTDWVRAVVMFPDGKHVASASDDHTIRIWDLVSFQCNRIVDTGFDWLRVIAVSKNGSILFTGDDSENIKAWEVQTGHQLGTLVGHIAKVNAIRTLSDGRVITVSDDRSIRIWDGPSQTQVMELTGHTGRIVACAVSDDESAILTAATDNTIFLWPIQGDGKIQPWLVTSKARRIRDLAFTHGSTRVITASEHRELEVWDVSSGDRKSLLEGHTDWVNAVVVSAGENLAVSASDDGTLKIWRLGAVDRPASGLSRHNGLVRDIACHPNERYVYSAGNDQKLFKWDSDDGSFCKLFDSIDVHHVTMDPSGEFVICAEGDAVVRVRSSRDCSIHTEFRNHADRVRAITVSKDGRLVASAGDDRVIRIWRMTDGGEIGQIQVGANIRALAFPNGNETLLSGSVSGRIKLLDIDSGRITADMDEHTAKVNAFALDLDAQLLFSASDDHTLRIWDLTTVSCKFVLAGHNGQVRGVAVSGKIAVSAAEDATVRIWDTADGTQLAVFTGESPFVSCAFTSDGRRVIAGDRQGFVHFLEPRIQK
jgi:WD40 repeat protein